MKVTFIHHSCFCVEIEDRVFIFDYFKGNRIPEFQFQGVLPEFNANQSIYVFASHQHRDHFDKEIFTWREKYPNIQYIFPKEIKLGDNYFLKDGISLDIKEQIHHIKANSSLSLDGVEIETLLSTDEGVAFVVSYGGKTIYHAGDLHWWHWDGEDPVFNEYQEKTYKRQMDKLKDRKLDVAFVVIDQRLEQAIFWGIDYFMEHVDAEYVIPMHLWQNYDLITRYKGQIKDSQTKARIIEVNRENQVFEL